MATMILVMCSLINVLIISNIFLYTTQYISQCRFQAQTTNVLTLKLLTFIKMHFYRFESLQKTFSASVCYRAEQFWKIIEL